MRANVLRFLKRKEGCVMKRKTEGRTTPMQWAIRILILVIFVAALAIGANRLMEWNRLRQQAEELQQEKESYQNSEEK